MAFDRQKVKMEGQNTSMQFFVEMLSLLLHPCVKHLLGVVVFVEADVDSGDMFEGKVL